MFRRCNEDILLSTRDGSAWCKGRGAISTLAVEMHKSGIHVSHRHPELPPHPRGLTLVELLFAMTIIGNGCWDIGGIGPYRGTGF